MGCVIFRPMKADHNIVVECKIIDGQRIAIPICRNAVRFAELLRQTYLSSEQCKQIQLLGYDIVERKENAPEEGL